MKSIRQATQRLPSEFVDRLYQLFDPNTVDKIIKGFAAGRFTTLRVNTLKTDVRSLMEKLGRANIKYDRVLWYEDALVIKNAAERDIEKLDAYTSGELYMQSLSSMVPPLVLDPRPGERVLDLTAAPGSKTTQLAALMRNEGYVLANDINQLRAERLKFNVERQGASIVEVRVEDGKVLGREMPESFDRVLLDAPCSGEGLFLTDFPSTYRHWSTKAIRKYSSDQRKLFASAFEALKPGGVMVYSTCTLAPEENEMVIDWALKTFEGLLEVQDVDVGFAEKAWMPGLTEVWAQKLSEDVKKAVRILPSERMEGFFVAKLRKLQVK